MKSRDHRPVQLSYAEASTSRPGAAWKPAPKLSLITLRIARRVEKRSAFRGPDGMRVHASDARQRGVASATRQHRNAPFRSAAAMGLVAAMQDPRAAADELERMVKELEFKGALINGHTRGVYLDDELCLPFWERAAALDVPVYLHPANPMTIPAAFCGNPGLAGAIFGWAAETGGHALRLVLSGLVDRFPSLTIILGRARRSPFPLAHRQMTNACRRSGRDKVKIS